MLTCNQDPGADLQSQSKWLGHFGTLWGLLVPSMLELLRNIRNIRI